MARPSKNVKVEVTQMGKKFKSEGKTVEEAINNLKVPNSVGKIVMIVTQGDKKQERILPHLIGKKLFNTSGLVKSIVLKHVSNLF